MVLIFTKQFVAGALALILGSASSLATDTPTLKKVRIGDIPGSSCHAPLYIAYEKDFFKEEGLDAEIIRGDWDFIKESLPLGKIDATQGMVMTYLKSIEQDLDVNIPGVQNVWVQGVGCGTAHVNFSA